jgi:hypothetical protein
METDTRRELFVLIGKGSNGLGRGDTWYFFHTVKVGNLIQTELQFRATNLVTRMSGHVYNLLATQRKVGLHESIVVLNVMPFNGGEVWPVYVAHNSLAAAEPPGAEAVRSTVRSLFANENVADSTLVVIAILETATDLVVKYTEAEVPWSSVAAAAAPLDAMPFANAGFVQSTLEMTPLTAPE